MEGLHNFYYQLLLRLKGLLGDCKDGLGVWKYPDFPIEMESVVKRVYQATRSCIGCAMDSHPDDLPELQKVRSCLKPLLELEDERMRKPKTFISMLEEWQDHWLLKLVLSVASAIGLWPAIERLLRRSFNKAMNIDEDDNQGGEEEGKSLHQDEKKGNECESKGSIADAQ
mmetsp:Transcript_46156/g.74237  ORF Transcript_46156/g.74237 Transcript_46156/m.74237 type:complete len:170 (+) Transcript_46156:3-512(+)